MNILYIAAAVVCVWLICGVLACGWMFASLQRGYPDRDAHFETDQDAAALMLIGGPFALGVPRDDGWLWPLSRKAKVEAGILLELRSIHFYGGGWCVCFPQELESMTKGEEVDKVKRIFMTPEALEAMPEFDGL